MFFLNSQVSNELKMLTQFFDEQTLTALVVLNGIHCFVFERNHHSNAFN